MRIQKVKGRRPRHTATAIRDLDAGSSASALDGERDIVSPLMIEQLIAEAPPDQSQTLPVGALRAWKRRLLEEQLEELTAAGRLLPEPAKPASTFVACSDWNLRHPVGTKVRYFPLLGKGTSWVTVTRSEAWESSSGHVIVMVEGIAGGVHITHLEAL